MEEPRRFAIAISYAGEQRATVAPVADILAKRFGRNRVLYDGFLRAESARPNLNVHLPNLYRTQSELVVVMLSPDYPKKKWCGLELRFIRELIETQPDRVMLLSTGDPGDLSHLGILSGDGYLPIAAMKPEEIAAGIVERYEQENGMTAPNKAKPSAARRPKPTYPAGSREGTVLDWLQAPEAESFLEAQIRDIQANFQGVRARDAKSVVDFFVNCDAQKVRALFYSVRRASKASLPALTGGGLEAARKAVEGLYLLAAGKVVNRAAGQIAQGVEVRRVPDSELSVYAIVAAELFGGELQFRRNSRTRTWEPRYVFRIHAPAAGDNQHQAFMREVYRRVVVQEDEDAVLASRNDSELTKEEAARLRAELGDIRHVQRAALALVDAGASTGTGIGEAQAEDFARRYQAPVMLPDPRMEDGLVEFTKDDLLAELEQLWKLLYGEASPPPAPPPADSDIGPLIARLVEMSKDHPSPEIRKAVEDIRKLHAGTLPERDKLQQVADIARKVATPMKDVAEGVESGSKIAGTFATLYNVVAPLVGLPTLPKP